MDVLEGVGCDWILNELGPPPDAILRIPPPPLPSFIDWDGWMKDMVPINHEHEDNDTLPCHWCHLTRRLDVPAPAASDAEMAMEETWFFVILASSLMLLLGVLLSALVYWTLNRKTMKGTWDFGSFFSESGTVLMGGCSSPSSQGNDLLKQNDQADNGIQMATPQQATAPPPTRALWAGVKTLSEGNHYTITHAQPFEQRVQRNRFAPADEDSAGYTTLQPTRLDYPTDNQIYYCCTDLMVMSPTRPGNVFKVTSLDDSVDPMPNSLYVNMSPVNHPFRTLNQQTPCNATCCPLRAPCHPLNSLAINRSTVSPLSPALHLHPVLGENWRKV